MFIETTIAKYCSSSSFFRHKLNVADTYNGASRDNYAWSQTLKDVDVKVFVPPTVTKAKQLSVDIRSDFIKVSPAMSCIISFLNGLPIKHRLFKPVFIKIFVWTFSFLLVLRVHKLRMKKVETHNRTNLCLRRFWFLVFWSR